MQKKLPTKKTKWERHSYYWQPDFCSSLINEGFIDEYQLIVNPNAMGSGMTIFNSFDNIKKFTLIQPKFDAGGKTVLRYKSKID